MKDALSIYYSKDALIGDGVNINPDANLTATVRAMFEARGVEAELVEMVCGGDVA